MLVQVFALSWNFNLSILWFVSQQTVFQRYLRPDKDYLSFSLIYNDGKRSLDLVRIPEVTSIFWPIILVYEIAHFMICINDNKICKDKVEAEVWFSGLKTLISSGQYGRPKIDGWNNGGFFNDVGSRLPYPPNYSSLLYHVMYSFHVCSQS